MSKLIVVDDQPVSRQVLGDIVSGHFDLVAAPDTLEQVWQAVRMHKPAAAIVDVNLGRGFGGWDGFRLARELIAEHPGLKVVLVSGYGESAYEDAARTLPGAVFIEKAALTSELLREVLARD